MKPNRNKLLVLLLCLPATISIADESEQGASFFRDSSTERQPASTTFPKYPSIARRDRIEGEATVCFKIDAFGNIKRPSVTNYSHRIFRRPVLRAIKKSKFEPLQPDQVLQKAKTCRTYRFRLEPVVAEATEE